MYKKIYLIFLLILTVHIHYAQQLYVTSLNDPDDPFLTVTGELRWAIEQANATPGADTVIFNLPEQVTIPAKIYPKTYLPPIIDTLVIDGNTQPNNGYTGNDPKIIIDGSSLNKGINIISIKCNRNIISNLAFVSCKGNYLNLSNASYNSIKNNIFYSEINDTSYSNVNFAVRVLSNSNYNSFENNFFGINKSLNPFNYSSFKGAIDFFGESYGVLVFNFLTGEMFQYYDNRHIPDSNNVGGENIEQANYFYNCTNAATVVQSGICNKISKNIFINNNQNISLKTESGGVCIAGNYCKDSPKIKSAFFNGGITQINGSSEPEDFIELYKSDITGIDAIKFLGIAITDFMGHWGIELTDLNIDDKIIAAATDKDGNTSEFNLGITVEQDTTQTSFCNFCDTLKIYHPQRLCTNEKIFFEPYIEGCTELPPLVWDFGDGSPLTTNPFHTYSSYDSSGTGFLGTYTIKLTLQGTENCEENTLMYPIQISSDCPEFDCTPSSKILKIMESGVDGQ